MDALVAPPRRTTHTHLLVLVIVVDAEDELSGRQSLGFLVRSGRIDPGKCGYRNPDALKPQ